MTHLPNYDPFSPQRQPPRTSFWPVAAVLALILAGLIAWRFWLAGGNLLDPQATPREVVQRGPLASDEQQVVELFEQASPCVVNITTSSIQRDALTLNLYEIPRGTGSGFVWDAQNGYIVTNYHVVEDAVSSGGVIRVTLKDDNGSHTAKLVGGAADFDLAVVKLDGSYPNLHQIPVGESKDLKVGQKVFAIGNPFGLDQSLSMGIISALGREIRTSRSVIKNVIQTDAAINPGNSGGPLLDSSGLLIGVNTAIASPTGAYAGIGFAIPVDTVNRIVPQIIERGKVGRPGLGIQIADARLARRWNIPQGVLVMEVVPDGPAAQAGIRPTRVERNGRIIPGDVILAIDDKPVTTPEELLDALSTLQVGDQVKMTILRDGQRHVVALSLQEI